MIQEKVWGTTDRRFDSFGVTVDELEILPGTFCSEHRHARKANLFICHEGRLQIRCWTPRGDPMTVTLTKGKSGLVPAGVWHQFRSDVGCRATEVCFIQNDDAALDLDIERRTQGGRG